MKKIKNNMEIPKKAFYPEINDSYSIITYYEKIDDKTPQKIRIPVWLSELISYEVSNECESALIDFKKDVFEMFKI